MDLFVVAGEETPGVAAPAPGAPLAVRMRPSSITEVVGQDHLLGNGQPLRRLLEGSSEGGISSVILWGPPGTGKTTLAYLVARAKGRRFIEISAVSSGVKELRAAISAARQELSIHGKETVLFIDEVHRFSKSQQDALLPAVENRWVTLIAATTENPSFSMVAPLLSRSLLLTLRPLTQIDLKKLICRAVTDQRGFDSQVTISDEAVEAIVKFAGADGRKSLTILEAAVGGAREAGSKEVTADHVSAAVDSALVRYGQDEHYDVASAFIKSMRGSDPDAAVHYLARMLEAGEDPRFIARRIMIAASEEVGLADPSVLIAAVNAAQAVALIGMPEARIILSQVTIMVATAPKSNAAYKAIDAAISDIRSGKSGAVPPHLRDGHYAGAKGLGHSIGYLYAHDYPHHIVGQQYLPNELVGTVYYEPVEAGAEADIAARLPIIREILHKNNMPPRS